MRHKLSFSSLYTYSPLTVISDGWLVYKAKRGDKEAYGRLYLKYLDAIYRYIFFRVNQDNAVAEDLTEIVFFKAWEKLDSFGKLGFGFKAWIYTIAHNLVIDHFRETIKRVELTESLPDETQNIEERLLQETENNNLLHAIKLLSTEQQEVITLKFIEGFTNKDISRMLDKHEDAIRALQHRALEKLRKILTNHE